MQETKSYWTDTKASVLKRPTSMSCGCRGSHLDGEEEIDGLLGKVHADCD